MKRNIAMLLQYDGSRYDGWQRQKNTGETIQGKLEGVLEKMTGTFQEVCGSGRTDAGVHAAGQVANVCLDTDMTGQEIQDYLNQYLPEDIGVLEVAEVPQRFHSRLHAKEKTYTYHIDTAAKCDVFQRKYRYTIGAHLDIDAMERTAGFLLGTHDFAGFCTNRNKKKSTVRTLKAIEIFQDKSHLRICITGDGFLYNMVRILVGTMVEAGLTKREPESVKEIFITKDRQSAGFTAPAKGLFLTRVVYEFPVFRSRNQ